MNIVKQHMQWGVDAKAEVAVEAHANIASILVRKNFRNYQEYLMYCHLGGVQSCTIELFKEYFNS